VHLFIDPLDSFMGRRAIALNFCMYVCVWMGACEEVS